MGSNPNHSHCNRQEEEDKAKIQKELSILTDRLQKVIGSASFFGMRWMVSGKSTGAPVVFSLLTELLRTRAIWKCLSFFHGFSPTKGRHLLSVTAANKSKWIESGCFSSSLTNHCRPVANTMGPTSWEVNESLVRKTQARNEYDKTIQETEAGMNNDKQIVKDP